MNLHPLIWHEWADDHALSERSLIWIRDHAERDDPTPFSTAIDQLRAGVSGVREVEELQVLGGTADAVEAWTWGHIPACGQLDLRWP